MNILVISNNPFSKYFNNGKTLEALFSWVPKENIAQLFFHDSFIPDMEFCENYFKVSDKEVLRNFFKKRKLGHKVQFENKVTNNNQYKRSIDLSSLQVFRDYLWKLGYKKKKREKLYSWVKEFSPTCIFFVGGNCGFAHEIAIDLSILYDIKLYTYFTDDYVIYPQNKNIFKQIQKIRLRNIYNRTINRSSLCFVIGEQMASEYSKYYKRSFIPVMNSVSIVDFPKNMITDKIIISYFGNLSLNRWKAIVRFAQLLDAVRSESKKEIVFNVYSTSLPNKQIEKLFRNHKVQYMGLVLGDDYRKALIHSNMLLHIESDEPCYKSLTKLSISTKLPEYMITCRPIIAYGPLDVASILLLDQNKIGYVIDSEADGVENVLKLKKILLQNYSEYEEVANRAFSYVSEHLSLEKVVEKFSKYFK